jgi:hypothetical protein
VTFSKTLELSKDEHLNLLSAAGQQGLMRVAHAGGVLQLDFPDLAAQWRVQTFIIKTIMSYSQTILDKLKAHLALPWPEPTFPGRSECSWLFTRQAKSVVFVGSSLAVNSLLKFAPCNTAGLRLISLLLFPNG